MNSGDAGGGASTLVALYQLVYASTHGGQAFVFPCDAAGTVELNRLSERARHNYLLARALVGGDFHPPTVRRSTSSLAVHDDDHVAAVDSAGRSPRLKPPPSPPA